MHLSRDGYLYKHVPETAATRLRQLGDVIPLPPLGIAVSAGDLVLAAGIATLLAASMRSEDEWPEVSAALRQRFR